MDSFDASRDLFRLVDQQGVQQLPPQYDNGTVRLDLLASHDSPTGGRDFHEYARP